MSDLDRPDQEAHSKAEELLPWYASGRLDPTDRMLVEEHLSACADCREQLGIERRLIREFRAFAPEVDAGWTRLRERIVPREPHRIQRKSAWRMVRHPVIATIAAAQVAFLVLGASILLWLSRPTYQTLGSPPPSPSADVIVMFRTDATIEDVKSSLKAANASIVDGPTDADAYLLHVPEQRRNVALARLRADDAVQMAEPIDGVAR